jgi:hypothetical protein
LLRFATLVVEVDIFYDLIDAIERHHSIADLLRRGSEEMFELHQAGNFNPGDLKAKTEPEKSEYPSWLRNVRNDE